MTKSYALTKTCLHEGCDRKLRECCVSGYCRLHRHRAPCVRSEKKTWKRENPRVSRDRYIQRTFKITLDDAEEILRTQGGACAICKDPLAGIVTGHEAHIDHCHRTGRVRGVLCAHCNLGLGHFRDSTEILGEAVAYLQK